jgi:hypothetical protein
MLWNNQRHNALYAALRFLSYPHSEERYYTFIVKWFSWLQQCVKTRSGILNERLPPYPDLLITLSRLRNITQAVDEGNRFLTFISWKYVYYYSHTFNLPFRSCYGQFYVRNTTMKLKNLSKPLRNFFGSFLVQTNGTNDMWQHGPTLFFPALPVVNSKTRLVM